MRSDVVVEWHCPECQSIFAEYVKAFAVAFGTGQELEPPIRGFSGRVLRGLREADFQTLSDNPERKVVFLLDSASLSDLVGLDGREILRQIGYDEDYIQRLVAQGTQFRLAIFPETAAPLATWDNLLDLVAEAYPEWQVRIEQARDSLKNNSYEDVISGDGPAAVVRRFLETEINVLHLFSGEGYTKREDDRGKRVYAEYGCLNRPLTDLDAFALIGFPVS